MKVKAKTCRTTESWMKVKVETIIIIIEVMTTIKIDSSKLNKQKIQTAQKNYVMNVHFLQNLL